MVCNECGGMLFVKKIEKVPEHVKDKINYERLCDVECNDCHKVFYSQPYDFGNNLNLLRKI